jgi:hypothetical protein
MTVSPNPPGAAPATANRHAGSHLRPVSPPQVTVGRLFYSGGAEGDRCSGGELTGGCFAVTIIPGLPGSLEQVWASPTQGCAAQVPRSIRPLARGRSAFDLLLKQHRPERGRPARCVFARATSPVGVA